MSFRVTELTLESESASSEMEEHLNRMEHDGLKLLQIIHDPASETQGRVRFVWSESGSAAPIPEASGQRAAGEVRKAEGCGGALARSVGPAVALLCLLILFAIHVTWVDRITRMTAQTSDNYVPAVHTARDLSDRLDELARTFSNAFTEEDLDLVTETEAERDEILGLFDRMIANSVFDPREAQVLKTDFEAYYTIAAGTVEAMIRDAYGETVSEKDLDLIPMVESKAQLNKDVLTAVRRSRESLSAHLSSLEQQQRRTRAFNFLFLGTGIVALLGTLIAAIQWR